MTSSDQPEYGERATPEEQARAIAASGGIQEWQRQAHLPPAAEHTSTPAVEPRTKATSGYTVNRFATIVLLAVGLVAVLQSAFGYLDLATTIQTLYTQQGIGEYTATELTTVIGISLVVLQALIWLITAYVSLKALSKGKTAWWIPLVGAGITFILTASLLAALLLADPAFTHYLGTA